MLLNTKKCRDSFVFKGIPRPRPRVLTITRGVIGAPAASAPPAVGPGALHGGEGALVSGVTLLLLRNSSRGRPEAHPNLAQLFIDLEPFQS